MYGIKSLELFFFVMHIFHLNLFTKRQGEVSNFSLLGIKWLK